VPLAKSYIFAAAVSAKKGFARIEPYNYLIKSKSNREFSFVTASKSVINLIRREFFGAKLRENGELLAQECAVLEALEGVPRWRVGCVIELCRGEIDDLLYPNGLCVPVRMAETWRNGQPQQIVAFFEGFSAANVLWLSEN